MRDPGEPYTEEELAELIAWDNTEPGLRMRLAHRQAQLARLAVLGAPVIILENQVRLIAEVESVLIEAARRGPVTLS